MADVRRGIWQPPAPEPVVVAPTDPTFHELASACWAAKKPELRPITWVSYENELTQHLLPFFARHRLSQITVQEVDRYRQCKVREAELRRAATDAGQPLLDEDGRVLRPPGATSINKTITRLGQVLEDAVEYGHLDRNPAKGKRRRLKASKNTRSHLDRADYIAALLHAAGQLDARALTRPPATSSANGGPGHPGPARATTCSRPPPAAARRRTTSAPGSSLRRSRSPTRHSRPTARRRYRTG
jgi:hypothetical protein